MTNNNNKKKLLLERGYVYAQLQDLVSCNWTQLQDFNNDVDLTMLTKTDCTESNNYSL